MDKEQLLEILSTDEGKEVLNIVNKGLLDKRDELLSKQVEMKRELEKYKGLGVDPDSLSNILNEYGELKQKASVKTEDKVVETDPKLSAKLEFLQSELDAKNNKLSSLQNKLISSAIDSTITNAIAKYEGIPELLKPMLSTRMKTELDDNAQLKITVLNQDGTAMFKNGEEATVEDLVAELKANEIFAGAFKAKPVSGSGTRTNTTRPTVVVDPNDPNFNLSKLMKKR